MHEVVDAREEQPLPAAQPADERVLERTRVALVALDGPGSTFDDALALVKPSDEPVAGAGGRPGDAREDGRRAGRPAVTGGE